ncbi:DUF6908 domain-containing protein [Tunturiibacter gelidoferens]|jgi:hypothetical protein|uniref:DUF6908 domain-containing protein n=1 Tax=Tunturiibacter gelidiferens TaxID=3069689 RepID=A0A9X0QIG3_9BACT|nr:hypothetical protein [Edaphobacter lichenicola]
MRCRQAGNSQNSRRWHSNPSLRKAGGWHPGLYLKIADPPYMELVIEVIDEFGPMGLPVLSVAQYGQQNGDLMRDLFLRDVKVAI